VLAASPGAPAEASLDSHPGRRPRLAVYSRLSGLDHPYFRLMHRALERCGISIAGNVEIGVSWLRSNRRSIDAVHFHWPETIWRDRQKRRRHVVARTLHAGREMLRVARFLREAHRLGIACVWTIHNLEPHEGGSLWDRLGYRLFARWADIVVSHSATALEDAAREYRVPAGHSLLMPMGAMHEAYPRARPRDGVLRELGLNPALPMISCLGRIREYKGLDLACAAVQRMNGRVQLAVAGPVHAGFDVGGLREAIARVPGAILIPRQLSDQEFADLMAASDAAFLPYRNVTGSAVLLTAIGFGRPVIATDLPYFREVLAPEPEAGALIDGTDADQWARAIEAFFAQPLDSRRQAAFRLADRYSWDRVVVPLADALAAAGCRA
jgi:glycosyltransferase involved in cell wall biosynthesis